MYNYGEADLAVQMATELLAAGLPESELGIISNYSAQVREIEDQLEKIIARQIVS